MKIDSFGLKYVSILMYLRNVSLNDFASCACQLYMSNNFSFHRYYTVYEFREDGMHRVVEYFVTVFDNID